VNTSAASSSSTSSISTCQEKTYFDPLYTQLENGGYAAMLHDLLQRDIRGFHPRHLPKTSDLLNAGLREQQQLSLEPLDSWWIELLESGTLEGADPKYPNQAVSHTYDREVTDGYGGRRFLKQPGLYDQARTIVPRLRQFATDHTLGHHLTNQGRISKRVLKRRSWRFPDLSEARSKWEERYPNWTWREPDLTEWQAPPEAQAATGDASGDACDASL
jgi:hypothetical protein